MKMQGSSKLAKQIATTAGQRPKEKKTQYVGFTRVVNIFRPGYPHSDLLKCTTEQLPKAKRILFAYNIESC